MPFCHRCGVQLTEGALFCINCGARQAEQVKVDIEYQTLPVTKRGHLLVQPIGFYNAPLDESSWLVRFQLKLLKLGWGMAFVCMGIIGFFVLISFYLLIYGWLASLLHLG